MGALMGKMAKTSIDKQFQDQVRDMLKPGTSALFLMLEKVTPDKAVEAMSKYGGTVLKTSLSKDDEKELQEALHGSGEQPPSNPCRSRAPGPAGPDQFGALIYPGRGIIDPGTHGRRTARGRTGARLRPQ